MRAAIGLLGVGLIVLGCSDGTGGETPQAQTTKGTPTSTSSAPPTPSLVAAAAAKEALLKRSELGEIIGDTELRQVQSHTKPWQSSDGADPRDCAPRLVFNEAVAASGYQLATGDTNRGARGQIAQQLITVFDNRDQPARVVGDLARMFGYCAAGEPFSTTVGAVTQHWMPGLVTSDATGPVSDATRAGAGAQRQEAPPRNCYHATVARANVVVESIVCGDGDSEGQANVIIDRIAAKFGE
jgi:PknH-like protein